MSRSFRTRQFGSLIGAALFAVASASIAMPATAAMSQAALNNFADHLGYKLTVVDDASGGFNTRLDLTLPRTGLPEGAWALYFGSVSPLALVGDSAFDLTHINGDNYRLTPKGGVTFKAGETYSITWAGHSPSEYLAMPKG